MMGIATFFKRKNAPTAEGDTSPVRRRRWPRVLRVLFLWIPGGLISLIILVLLAVNLFLTPSRVEKLAKDNYGKSMNGSLDLKVEKFSLFSGFVIRDIVIRNPEPFDGDFVRISKLVLDYSLPRIFTGSVHFYEIGIYTPEIWLVQKNGAWNYASLAKPSAAKEEVPEEKPAEEAGEPKKAIDLPISVDIIFKFILQDLSVYVAADTFTSHVKGFDFSIDTVIPPVRHIPLGVEAVKLIEKFSIQLNPEEKIDIAFASKEASVQPPLILSWALELSRKDNTSAFASRLRAGTYNAPVRFKRSHLGPLNFLISYDLMMDPIADRLTLDSLAVTFGNDRWLALSGTVDKLSGAQMIDIRMTQSRIDLSRLYPYYVSVTGDRTMRFGGAVSLYPLALNGTAADISLSGAVSIADLLFSTGDFELRSRALRLGYALAKRGAQAGILLDIGVGPFRYRLDREWSPMNQLSIKGDIDTYNDFGRIMVNSLDIALGPPARQTKAVSLAIKGDIRLKPSLGGTVRILPLEFNRRVTQSILPETIAASMNGIPFENSLKADINLDFGLGAKTTADLSALFRIPDMGIRDLTIAASVLQDNPASKVHLRKFTIASREFGVDINAAGMVETKRQPLSDSDIRLTINANSPKRKKLPSGMQVQGAIKISAHMKGDLQKGKATGSVFIKDLYFAQTASMTEISGLNMDFPFEYAFTPPAKGKTLLAVDKSRLIDSSRFRAPDNFTIASVRSKHPARDESFEYLKDFRASMKFKDNVFSIDSMKGSCMNGSIGSRDISFYLADMNKNNMEYRATLEITNVNVALLDEDKGKNPTGAELSMNMDVSGRGLDFQSDSWFVNGYVNIYKIGEEFANKLMKGLSEEKGKSKLGFTQRIVDNFNLPTGFYFNLEEANVYATVTLKRKVLGNVISIYQNKVQYDRIPIKEYLRKVRTTEVN